MTMALRHITIIVLTVLLFDKIYAQDTTTTNFFDQIKTYDLSTVLAADSILTEDREDGKDKFKRAEILGFIGDDYQRFFIHFVSVIQNPTNPYEYLVYGKTKVNETICSFQGAITIRQARIYKSGDIPTYKQGFATCDVILYEDKKQSSTGFIKGKLKSEFLIDNKGQFRYDALMFVAGSFSNNQFVGSWTIEDWSKTWLTTWNKAIGQNLFIDLPEISCPVYFFLGGKDLQTNSSIAKDYFKILKAPKKEIFLFENAGHSVLTEETEHVQKTIIEQILK